MKSTEWIGLAFLGGGVLLMIVHGLSNVKVSDIDPVVLTAVVAVFLGTIILFISTVTERRGKEVENITKEDLRP
jgi:membrane protein DedA with SNARE-associated domain